MNLFRLFFPSFIFLLHLLPFTMGDPSEGHPDCGKEQMQEDFLGLAAYFIGKVQKYIPPTCSNESQRNEFNDLKLNLDMNIINRVKEVVSSKDSPEYCSKPIDCADLFYCGHRESGVYSIRPKNYIIKEDIKVYCDMETDGGGWTVIQRRGNYGQPSNYFFEEWKSYKDGFGDIEKDFWLGNDAIFAISNQKGYTIRFDLADFQGAKRHAQYDSFKIENERRQYTLHIDHYSGDAGDSMKEHNGMAFSTKDMDNDKDGGANAAEKWMGAWWYRHGHHANLNSLFVPEGQNVQGYRGVTWNHWKGAGTSLGHTEMKIRGQDFSDQ